MIEALESANAYSVGSLSAPHDDDRQGGLSELIGEEEQGYEGVENSALVDAGLEGWTHASVESSSSASSTGLTQSQIAAEIGIRRCTSRGSCVERFRRCAGVSRTNLWSRDDQIGARVLELSFPADSRLPRAGEAQPGRDRPARTPGRGDAGRPQARRHGGLRKRRSTRLPG